MTTMNHASAPAPVGPRSLHVICELARLAACTYCPAAGLDWPCAAPGSGPEGYHVARFAAARRRGLITGPDLTAVLNTAGVFTTGTLIYDEPGGGSR